MKSNMLLIIDSKMREVMKNKECFEIFFKLGYCVIWNDCLMFLDVELVFIMY